MESINLKKLGKRIRSLRKEGAKKIKQKDFASRFGISGSTLSKYESGNLIPSLDFLLALILKKGISFYWLMTGKEYPNPEEDCLIIREPKTLYGEQRDNTKELIDNLVEISESGNKDMINVIKAIITVCLSTVRENKENENKGGD